MSGGYFNYKQHHITDIADELERLISKNEDLTLNEWGDTKGRFYSEATIEKFRTALKLLRTSHLYAHEIDYLLSADTDESGFSERLKEGLKRLESQHSA